MRAIINQLADRLGYKIIKKVNHQAEFLTGEFAEIYALCKPFTLTSPERMFSLYQAVEYVLKNNIPGDFVECGVWRGGSSMLIARIMELRNIRNRKIYLYDTFEGMSEPTSDDKDYAGRQAGTLLKAHEANKETSVWCLADLQDVRNNMSKTGLSEAQIVYVQGKVEDTLPGTMPDAEIALLRLDTDWYASTLHELIHLYPRLVTNGVLIIDDYGHWQGCRKAVDEYFQQNGISLLLQRIDYTGRIAIKAINA